jgi:hypothetical protein
MNATKHFLTHYANVLTLAVTSCLSELAKHRPLYEWIVRMWASLVESLDQVHQGRLARLAVEPRRTQRIASSTHTGSDGEAVVDARLHRVPPRWRDTWVKGAGHGITCAQPQSD